MKQTTLKKTMVISGVVGSIVLLNKGTVYAVENTNEIPQKSYKENVNSRISNKGQVVGVGSTYLRIRSLPSTDSEVLGTMRDGMKFDIISKDNGWYKIKYNNVVGYAFGEYVQEINSQSTENVLYYGKVYNAAPNLRVRSDASLSSSVIGYVVDDTTVSIVASENEWYKIKYNGAYGYVHKDYILVNGSDNSEENGSNNGSNNGADTGVKSTGYAYNLDGSALRIREKASTNSKILGNIYEGNSVNIIGEENNWYKISYNNRIAYVSKDYIKLDKPSDSNNDSSSSKPSEDKVISTGKVINVEGSNLRVRQGASTSHFVLGYLLNNETVDILGKEGNWYKIKYRDSVGYVSVDYIKVGEESNSGNTGNTGSTGDSGNSGNAGNTQNPSDNNASESEAYNIILNAMSGQVGAPYVWGGSGEYLTTNSLNSLKSRFPNETADGDYVDAEKYVDQGYRAFDCSGLMQWGFAQANINIGRSTYNQVNNGVEVSRESIKPGDLIFTDNLGHVGMYIGDDMWIESPNVGYKVRTHAVPWNRVNRIRRILK